MQVKIRRLRPSAILPQYATSCRHWKATMTNPTRPDYHNTDTYEKAVRCAEVLERWQGHTIDVNRDWVELIHSFAWAIGLRVRIDLVEGGDNG